MNVRFKMVVLALMLAVSTAAWFGCSSSSSSGGSSFTPGFVDLAVGDADNTNTCPADSKVMLYFDIFHNADSNLNPTADVVLDNATSGIAWPRSVVFGGNDLYVGQNTAYCGTTNSVSIFRDYRNLANNAAPDAVLSTLATISYVDQIVYSEATDILIVADRSAGQVTLFNNASAITADVAPDVVINAAAEILEPHGLALLEDATAGTADLFVGNKQPSTTDACVSIYRNIEGLATGPLADARLNEDTSFFGFGTDCYKVDVYNNTLYVMARFNETGIFIFNNADALTDDALPDIFLTASGSGVLDPLNVTVVNDTLWVADGTEEDDCGAHVGILGFANASSLVDDQSPVAVFPNTMKAHYARSAAGSLFVDPIDGCDEQLGNVYIWTNAATASSGQGPDIKIVGGSTSDLSVGLIRPISIDVKDTALPDLGT